MQRGGHHRPTWSWDAEPFVGGWWSCHRLLNPSLMRCTPPSPAASLESPGHVGGCFAEQPFFNLRSCIICSCEAEVSGLESTLVSGDDNPQPAANTDFSFVSFLQHERLSR